MDSEYSVHMVKDQMLLFRCSAVPAGALFEFEFTADDDTDRIRAELMAYADFEAFYEEADDNDVFTEDLCADDGACISASVAAASGRTSGTWPAMRSTVNGITRACGMWQVARGTKPLRSFT